MSEQSGIYLHIDVADGLQRIDFDKRQVRRAMVRIGAVVRKDARRLVARRAISSPGEYPGADTGALKRSITSRVSKPGFLVVIRPVMTSEMDAFYPAYLWYGVRRLVNRKVQASWDANRKRKKGHTEITKAASAWRIAPRKNYMTDALAAKRGLIQQTLAAALENALKPG